MVEWEMRVNIESPSKGNSAAHDPAIVNALHITESDSPLSEAEKPTDRDSRWSTNQREPNYAWCSHLTHLTINNLIPIIIITLGIDILVGVVLAVLMYSLGNDILQQNADLFIALGARVIGVLHETSTAASMPWKLKSSVSNLITMSFFYLIFRTVLAMKNVTYVYVSSYVTILLSVGIFLCAIEANLTARMCVPSDIPSSRSKNLNNGASTNLESLTSSTKKPTLGGMGALRFLASLHIVLFHFYNDGDEAYSRFVSWGGSGLTLFFVLSGFVLAYQYGDQCNSLNSCSFWIRRFAHLYPIYFLSILAMCLLLPRASIDTSVLSVVLSGVQTWVSWAFLNNLNTPGWTVGAFLFLYLIFPVAMKIISATTDTRTLLYTCCWFWLLCVVGTAVQESYVIGAPFYFLYQLVFKAHLAEFLFGITLGWLYQQYQTTEKGLSVFVRSYGASIAVLVLVLLFSCVDIHDNAFMYAFSANGLLAPVHGLLIWGLAGYGDMLLSVILSSNICQFLGDISFEIYVLQAVVYEFCLKYGYPELFLPVLVVVSAFVHCYIAGPLGDITTAACGQLIPTVSFTRAVHRVADFIEQRSRSSILLVTLYYLLMGGVIAAYAITMIYSLEGGSSVVVVTGALPSSVYNGLKWVVVIGVPAVICTLVGQLGWCPWWRVKVSPLAELIPQFEHRMFFRIVTRGLNPILVQQNAMQALAVLDACLPRSLYMVEVVTDNEINVADYLREKFHPTDCNAVVVDTNFIELVVPSSYQCESGAKYKARALHYAICHSQCSDQDWIIHLDEETRFTVETVQYCLKHCLREDQAIQSGLKSHPNIGQGVIFYGCNPTFENYVTTLADSARVADDYGKFRFQYETHSPWIGMHGSFVVCSQSVEKLVGFDNGLEGSITEDAYFALAAWAKGIKFSWVDAYMYEQSPFSIQDFIMQRRRWFGGLWLVCRATSIPLRYRLTLFLMILTWAGSSLPLIMNATGVLFSTTVPTDLKCLIAVCSAVFCWNYLLGFLKTYSIRDGVVRYLVLLFLQIMLQPIFAVMELAGVMAAIISPPVKGFHIVKKEGKNVLEGNAIAAS